MQAKRLAGDARSRDDRHVHSLPAGTAVTLDTLHPLLSQLSQQTAAVRATQSECGDPSKVNTEGLSLHCTVDALDVPTVVLYPHHLCSSCYSIRFSSVTQLPPTLCDPMDCSMPGFPVHHQLLELAQTHVHGVGDAIQPSHPLSSPSPDFNLSQNQNLFQ